MPFDLSVRTKQALAAAKARGRQLGDPKLGQRNAAAAYARAAPLRTVVAPLARQGWKTRQIAAKLNARRLTTARGGRWRSMTVLRLLQRLELR